MLQFSLPITRPLSTPIAGWPLPSSMRLNMPLPPQMLSTTECFLSLTSIKFPYCGYSPIEAANTKESLNIMSTNCIWPSKESNIPKLRYVIRKPMESANGCIVPCKRSFMLWRSGRNFTTAWPLCSTILMNGWITTITSGHTVESIVLAKRLWKLLTNPLP
jgi:hypothetical protein